VRSLEEEEVVVGDAVNHITFAMHPSEPAWDTDFCHAGAQSVLAAFTRDDFPEDPDRIFLTSWGEWWEADVIKHTLDKMLQDKWCFTKEQIEESRGLAD
jgi:hypothetical protein